MDKNSNTFQEFKVEMKQKLNSLLLDKIMEAKKNIASQMVGEENIQEANSYKNQILSEAKIQSYTNPRTLSKVSNYMSKISTSDIERLLKKGGYSDSKVADLTYDEKISLNIHKNGTGLDVLLDVEFDDDGSWGGEEPFGGIRITFDSNGNAKSADFGGDGTYFD